MHINLTKVALLAAVYFLYKNSLQMNEYRRQLRQAGITPNNNVA